MPDYFYDMDLVVDPLNPSNVVANGSVAIYDPADTAGTTLLALKDPSGLPLPNPLTSNANGFLPPRIAQLPQIMWKSGGFVGYFNSFKGLRDEAIAAKAAAQEAVNSAVEAAGEAVAVATINPEGNLILTKVNGEMKNAGSVKGPKGDKGDKGTDGSNVLPTDTAIKDAITTPGTQTATALSATILAQTSGKLDASAVVKGAGSTRQIGAFVNKLKKGANSAAITALGDSTGASPTGWLIELVRDRIAPAFPAYTVQTREWSDAHQKYADVSTVLQTGTAGLRRLVSTGASTDKYFTVADSAATSPTGDIDARFRVTIPALGAAFTLGGKYDTGTNNRAWFIQVNANGTISFFFSTDGTSTTQLTRTSTVTIPPAAVGVPAWIRTTFDVDDGAGNNVARFYYSTDNTNWTQIGSTVTNVGVQSIFDATTATQINSRGGTANSTGGAIEYYAFQLYTSLTANARPVIDLETGQWNGFGTLGSSSAQFVDFVGNTVQVNATGTTGAMAGAPVLTLLNGCVPGQNIAYANDATRQPKLTPLPSDLAVINFSHNEVGSVAYRVPYKQLADALIAKWPDVGIIANAQNPRKAPATNIVEHSIRVDQINALAASQGYALIDAYNTLAADMNLVLADGIHPTDAGYDAIRDVAYKLFNAWI